MGATTNPEQKNAGYFPLYCLPHWKRLMYETAWIIKESKFDPKTLHHKETVFTLGNGYLGTRGSFEEGYPGAKPATLINGVYDDVAIAHTELANCPDWLPLVFRIGKEYFSLNRGTIVSYKRELDMYRGILSREVRWRSRANQTLDFHFQRFASLADEHVLCLRCIVTAVDFEGEIELQAGINGYLDNEGIRHWEWLEQGEDIKGVWLRGITLRSRIELGIAQLVRVFHNGIETPVEYSGVPGYPAVSATIKLRQGETITIEKLVTVFTSREKEAPAEASRQKLLELPNYENLKAAHEKAWAKIWENSDVVIQGDRKAQQAVRYNLFQIIAAAPRHDERVGIPAKTLSGFAYRGHNFWDTEIFILPFLTYTQPEIARNLLTYRYHTLAGARRKAREAGYQGAMFAWESAATGDEVTPRWVPSPNGKDLVRIWCGDIELHITADVAYAVWHYWKATADDEWMCRYGAEILLETARFWSSRVETRDSTLACSERPCYEIRHVIGPDEYHDRVDNNAFTNKMVQWNLEVALSVLDWLRAKYPARAAELEQKLNLNSEQLERWADIIERMWIPYNPETGLIEQFEGFFQLEDINLAEYEPRRCSMQALLGIEGAAQRQVIKQADVLMLLYLLRERFDLKTLVANWNYYNPRTDHTYGSSLSPAIHAILACDLNNPTEAYQHFMRAALVDLEDTRGNAADGIHAASAGGVWQAVVFGFAGVKLTEYGPVANPRLPAGWMRLQFKLNWRGHWYKFDLKGEDTGKPEMIIPQSLIRGVIFDLDGVLTDTAKFHYLAWKQLADEEGIPFDEEANEKMRGLSRRDSLLRLLGERIVSETKMQEMMERKNAYYLKLTEQITASDLLPGAGELLDELRASGIKIAIGSASKNARQVIERLGIANKIDVLADGYSVERSKPAPDLFLHAAKLLKLRPEECLVVEDAAAGVEAALAAGMWVVGLGRADIVGAAHIVLPSLEGVNWQGLLARLTNAKNTEITADEDMLRRAIA